MVKLDLTKNGNVGIILVNEKDIEFAKKVDELATIAWRKNNNFAGFEYFEDIAQSVGLSYCCVDK